MLLELRRATGDDIGRIAYMMLKWDAELPSWLQKLEGNAAHAETAAMLVVESPDYEMWGMFDRDTPTGGMCVQICRGLFTPHKFAQLVMWYVLPEYRGPQMIGLKLLQKARSVARDAGCKWLELHPWADDNGTRAVLERMGAYEASHNYVLEIS